jgi:alpha-L-fucosidase
MNALIRYLLAAGIILLQASIPSFGQNLVAPSNTIKIQGDSHDQIIEKAAHVIPTLDQYNYKKLEFTCFVHFGPNTFTRMEWGSGKEDPKIFNLQNLDTDQWCRAMKEAGMKLVVITAKHHDGFVLWQSRYTTHGVMSSPFRDGKGDILKDLSESCKKYGIKLGVYLSPADLFQIESKTGLYGNLSEYTMRTIPRPVDGRPFENKTTFQFEVDDYNEYFLNQLFELLTEYGPIHEVWFDGAHPKRKGGQTYNYTAWRKLIRTLVPNAVIFGREDVRWCGNESGKTRDTEWDIIPFDEDPNVMIKFADLTGELGSREHLYVGNYLHYIPAETNTSIREGWFYRDETDQKVRNADDVFDIYERSVGGNSTFLLNIPPNREGLFSDEDVNVLVEVGKRIRETYGINLLERAEGPVEILDQDEFSFVQGNDDGTAEFIIETQEPITINRFLLQEAISTHSQRIESHALYVWLDGEWKEIATGTTVGYKKILRFPVVESGKFRIRILGSRLQPTLSNVSAHYYKSHPPQISISRGNDGMVTLQPQKHHFKWKSHGLNPMESLNRELEIRYAVDGSKPSASSNLYTGPFYLPSGSLRVVAFDHDQKGGETSENFGILKKEWQLLSVSSKEGNKTGQKAFDGDPATIWQSKGNKNHPHNISIDLGSVQTLSAFGYTPRMSGKEGMIEKGKLFISENGKKWQEIGSFEFGNLINDPVRRIWKFDAPAITRFFKIESETGAGASRIAAIAEIDLYE